MAERNEIHFDITASSTQAKREIDELRRKLRTLTDEQVHSLEGLNATQINKSVDRFIQKNALAAKGVDDFGKTAHRARSDVGQFIEAIARGDPGELLGEIAQAGGGAGAALAGLTLVVAGAAVALGLMTKAVIENAREVNKLAREYNLTSIQIQSLQSLAIITGESVEDLAENFAKVAPQAKELEAQIKATGAEIDEGLRRNTQKAIVAFEELHIAATGAMNDIVRGALPETIELLNSLALLLSQNRELWQGIGDVAGTILQVITAGVNALNKALSDLPLLFANLTVPGSFIASTIQSFNSQDTSGGIDFTDPFNIPSLKKGGKSGGQKDISSTEVRIAELKAEQQAAQDALNGTVEAAERLYKITLQIHQLERELAANELPNQQRKKLIEIQTQEREALLAYNKEVAKIQDEQLKPIAELSKRINESIVEGTRLKKEQDRADQDLLNNLKEMELRLKAIIAETARLKADIFSDSVLGRLNPRAAINKQADAAKLSENLRSEDFNQGLSLDRSKLGQSFEDNLIEYDAFIKQLAALDAQEEAERERHMTAIEAIDQRRINQLKELSPLTEAFLKMSQQLFGETSTAALEFAQILEGAFSSFAQGIGSMVESFVLLGTTGPAVLRKLTAQVLAQVASQAAVLAIFELAKGFAALFFNPAEAAAHFQAAALFGSVAAVAGVAGRAVAGDSFQSKTSAAGAANGGSSARPLVIDGALADRQQQTVVVNLRARVERGVIVETVTDDFNRNGATRQTVRTDVGDSFPPV